MTNKYTTGVTRSEAAAIRNQLRYRRNHLFDCWEIYTTIHGTGVFRWMKVSQFTKDWYLMTFPGIGKSEDVFPRADGSITA
jgi:hypothetical protein